MSTVAIKYNSATGEIFDSRSYQDASVGYDGHEPEKLVVAFSGKVELDPHVPHELAIWERLRLGRRLDLRVDGVVTAKQAAWKIKDDDDVVTGKATVKVDSLFLLSPEQL